MDLTQARVRELFDYKDGALYWRIKPSRDTAIGAIAGTVRKDGYRAIRFEKKQYLAHRLIFLWHHGQVPRFIDHIDRNPRNNRIENLRAATHRQNHMNREKQSNNSTGFKGISWIARDKKFQAKIKVGEKHLHLGYFDDPEIAYRAYVKAARKHFGEFSPVSFVSKGSESPIPA